MSTYSWNDAIKAVGATNARLIQENLGPLCADMAQSMIWNAADWRVSIGELTPFYLVAGQQDYDEVPSDFLGLKSAYVLQTDLTPACVSELNLVRMLARDTTQGPWLDISYEPSVGKFRFHFVPPDLTPVDTYQVVGTYKKAPTKVTSENVSSTKIPWDDAYFQVCVEALRYQFYLNDPAKLQLAGSIIMSRGVAQYTGQLGVAMTFINNMMDAEYLNLGQPILVPGEPLVR